MRLIDQSESVVTSIQLALRPYHAIQNSGVSWLGQVPTHWEVARIKHLVRMRSGDGITAEEIEASGPYPVYGGNGLRGFTHSYTHAGDFILIGRQGALCGNIQYASGEFWASEHAVVCTPTRNFCQLWLGELLKIMNLNQYSISAAQPGLAVERIQNLQLPMPPVAEQEAIGRFIRYIDDRVNRLIKAKRRLIELLNEQKQAIIHRAVTRGLDSTVALKPSGIEWLEMIPTHWTVMRIGTLASSLQTGPFGSQLHAADYESGGIPVINPSHMKYGKIVPDLDCAVGSMMASKLERHRLEEGDIILARRGELGRCALVRASEAGWICGTGSIRMRLQPHLVDTEYLLQLLLSKGVAEWLSLQSVGSTMENLNTGILTRLPLPIPPYSEQCSIIAYIAKQQRSIDNAVSRARFEIDLVHEYRTRLVADVVTGQLDVRNVVLTDDFPVSELSGELENWGGGEEDDGDEDEALDAETSDA